MKKSEFIIHCDLGEGKYLLVSSLTGKIAVLTQEEYDLYLTGNFADNTKLLKEFTKLDFYIEEDMDENEIYNKHIKNLKMLKDKKTKNITNAVLILSYDCNFACPYCYERGNTGLGNTRMTIEQIDKILNDNEKLQEISFFGGEPFLPENRSSIQYILKRRPNVSYSAMTNGFYLKEYCDIFKGVNISFIQVTLDGPCEIHNKTRVLKTGEGTFKIIYAGIYKALKSNIPIKIRMNITSNNYVECLEFRMDLLTELKEYRDLLTFELYPVFQLNETDKQTITREIIMEDLQLSKISELHLGKLDSTLTSGLPIEKFISTGEIFHPIISFCDAHEGKRFYDPYGDMYSCILSVGNKKAAIGKFFPEYIEYDDSFIKRDISQIKECNNCKMGLICGGGCPYALLLHNENIMKPNCSGIEYALNFRIPEIIRQNVIWR